MITQVIHILVEELEKTGGEQLVILTFEPSDEERFWAMVNKQEGKPEESPGMGPCWLWEGALTFDGYGKFSANGQTLRAHRVSNTLLHGPIRRGLLILHRCDNRRCVNPDHHLRGTTADNNQDKLMKLRNNFYKRGEE